MRSIIVLVLGSLLIVASGCDASAPALAAPPTRDAETAPGPSTAVIPSVDGVVGGGWAPDFGGFAGTSVGCMRSFGSGHFVVTPALEEGDQMLSLVVAIAGNLSADLTLTSAAVAPNGDRFLGTVGSLDVPNVSTGFHDYVIDLTDTIVIDGMLHWFEFTADQGGLCVGAVRLTYDHPGR
jgi:hypothetical protein